MLLSRSLVTAWFMVLAAAALVGCSSTPLGKAPVEDRSSGSGAAAAVKPPPPGIENAGKPGYYTVKPGDTLIRISLENGQSWKDVARWNNLDNPNLIEVGQVLRVVPPGTAVPSSATAAAGPGVVTHPVASSSVAATAPAATAASAPKSAASAATATAAVAPSATSATAAAPVEDDVSFIWPASGSLLAGFDEARNKGYDIAGKAGDPVYAAADGRVVYAGAGLRGYGNLIILKHSNTFLTAYAHNQALLVKEDQTVKRGQKIAEMGSTDADRVKLHFEIRKQGKPVDPARYLPSR
ncbi:peptidoglycan DD-metalloendopeptidase family protein [Extensimonas sp. H3M7-6]|jgi:lipoprotein NlpD|uniref:peptidoglycan DD-metalloendopeptidase family protein n=1 Tax=Extensimonas soli TaxID=3031322 RepID=UPI0023DC7E2E|nr:peptidoglycan DD-metalloendopeptidase family protein [Extensimonas sp. H3M7-6]MDF1482727.1 peptidoglycan DD-metalloendopeptidase family protein [Extensimonas sp. H3M7-6]